MSGAAGPAAAAAARPAPVPGGGPGRPEAGSPAPVIEAAGLASQYRGRTVWSGADFSVGAGEFLTVLGPNGAGKSTQLRTLDPDLGVRAADMVGLGVDGHRWGAGVSPRKRREKAQEVTQALASVGAAHLAGRAVGRLSGGEQQRLQLAQALVSRPRLLLLDEPLASLDLRSQQEVSQLIADLQAEYGFTVVLVTHDINPVLGVTDRVMYVAGGGVSVGPPEEVITSASLSRLYQADVEVLTDSRGRIFVVGLEAETAHPHSPRGPRP